MGLAAAIFGKRYALLCDFLQRRCDARLILENLNLEQEITEGKERLAELFDARLEFLYARLQIDYRGLFSLAICLLRDAKLRSTSLDSLSQFQVALQLLKMYPPREFADRPSQFVAGLSCEARVRPHCFDHRA